MSHSLRCRLKGMNRKKLLTDRELERLCKALDNENVLEQIRAEWRIRKGRTMTKSQLNELVEHLITIRDMYDLTLTDKDTLADACNVIYHGIDVLAESEEEE